jgi:hypothetical protein
MSQIYFGNLQSTTIFCKNLLVFTNNLSKKLRMALPYLTFKIKTLEKHTVIVFVHNSSHFSVIL